MKRFIFFSISSFLLLSCDTYTGLYSTLSFDNQRKEPIYLVYTQENGKSITQEIGMKEDLNMMFDKKWTDKNIKDVVNNIKEIKIYNKQDTLLKILDKQQLFDLFKNNRTLLQDRITFRIE